MNRDAGDIKCVVSVGSMVNGVNLYVVGCYHRNKPKTAVSVCDIITVATTTTVGTVHMHNRVFDHNRKT